MSMWTVTDGVNTYVAGALSYKRELSGINTGEIEVFVYPAGVVPFTVGDLLTLKYLGTNVETGLMIESCNESRPGLWSVTVREQAMALKNIFVENSSVPTWSVIIDNTAHDKRITDFVTRIIKGDDAHPSGWTDGSGNTSYYVPHSDPPEYLPSLGLFSSTCTRGLEKFLHNICGYSFWFDNASKKVYYGDYNHDLTSENKFPIEVRPVKSNLNYDIDRVVVIGRTDEIGGMATKGGASYPYKTLMYQYEEASDENECSALALQILMDHANLMERFEVDFIVGTFGIYEGDKIKITDGLHGINQQIYGVKDVTITNDKTTVGLGYAEVTIFDLLGDKLREISGTSDVGTNQEWNGGLQDIGEGIPGEWRINFYDADKVTNFKFRVTGTPYRGYEAADNYGTGGYNSTAAQATQALHNVENSFYCCSRMYFIGGTQVQITTTEMELFQQSFNFCYYPNYGVPHASTDRIDVDNSNQMFSHDDQVSFYCQAGLPGGLSEGTIYYVINTPTLGKDSYIEVSLSKGGSKVDITNDGQGYLTVFSQVQGLTDEVNFGHAITLLLAVETGSGSLQHLTFWVQRKKTGTSHWVKCSDDYVVHVPASQDCYQIALHIPIMIDPKEYTPTYSIWVVAANSTSVYTYEGEGSYYAQLGIHMFTSHVHPMYNPYHATPFNDPTHGHLNTINTTAYDAYCSNISLSITNSKYPTGKVIGTKSTLGNGEYLETADISADLADGENLFQLDTATSGGVTATAKYMSYGG